MAEKGKDKFYSNKEIFEMLLDEQRERLQLKQDLALTREYIKRYNNLRQEIEDIRESLDGQETIIVGITKNCVEHMGKMEGRKNFGKAIRDWGGWLFALITLLILLFTVIGGI